LAAWRNDRIHARVRMTADGYALYDWRTRHRLEMSRAEIEEDIQLAIHAMVELEAHVPDLVQLLKWEDEFDQLFNTLPELSAEEDNGDCEAKDTKA
jgi:hypothetical protein